jgi:hypothetical protein
MLTKLNCHEKKYLSCFFIETELFYDMHELSKDASFFTHYYSHNVYSEKSKFKFRS